MTNISAKSTLLLALLLLPLTAGCPAKEEQAQQRAPLKPNISKPQAAEVEQESSPAPEAIATNERPAVGESPQPEGSGSDAAVPQPPVSPSNAAPEVPAENVPAGNDSPAAPLADLPKHETPIWKPTVVMSGAHQNTCAVKVGDAFPPLSVQTLAGEPADTSELLTAAFAEGKRLAVVVVWNSDNVYGPEQFSRLQEELIEPFGNAGVQVVAIHKGEANEKAKQLAGSLGDSAVSLIDPDGTAFAKLATEKLPRTYLIDSQGKIIWLDLEYSSGTRRDLRNAIMYHLTRQVAAAN